MFRKAILLALLLGFARFLYAQMSEIDSLKQLLLTEKQDTSRSLILTSLGNLYIYTKSDTALLLAQQGITLAKQIGFLKGELTGLNLMGVIMSNTGNYPKALELYLTSLKISEANQNIKGIVLTLSNIGSIYSYQKDYKKSLYYFQKALKIAEEKQLVSFQTPPLVNIGDAYEKQNQLDSAILFTQRAHDLSLKTNDDEIANIALNNMGNIYAKMNKPIIAMEFYRSSLQYLEQTDDYYGIPETTIGMAKLFEKSHQSDSALYYANLAMINARKGGFIEGELLASAFLAEFYKSQNKHDSASFYFQETIKAKDSLFNQEKNRQIQNLSFNEMLRQQDILEQQAIDAFERRNNLEYTVIIICIICFAVLFILLSRSIIINEKWIGFLGVLGLLVVFEFINLLIHPYLADLTNHSSGGMLLIMVAIAAMLVPIHHRIERWVNDRMIVKNRAHRLLIARKIVERLEKDSK